MTQFHNSAAVFQRAKAVIPGGVWGHNRFPAAHVPGAYPIFAERGEGSRIVDVDGREYIDFLCGYGAMITGYANPEIDSSVVAQLQRGDCFPQPTAASVELAEVLVAQMPAMSWAAFSKNGSDATTVAVLIARAATNKRKIVVVSGSFNGAQLWCGWCNPGKGRSTADYLDIIEVGWNSIEDLENTFNHHGNDIAAVLVTPIYHPFAASSVLPDSAWLTSIRFQCDSVGAVIISDDVRCGFRFDLSGSHTWSGLVPDLVCLSKALANTHPLAVTLGTGPLYERASEVFMSGTFWNASAPMAAALKNIEILRRDNGVESMWRIGSEFWDGLVAIGARSGFDVVMTGVPSMPTMNIAGDAEFTLMKIFCAAMVQRGVLLDPMHNWFLSAAHTSADIASTLEAAEACFSELGATASSRKS